MSATPPERIGEHDVVRLWRQVKSWPIGQEGTVVAEKGEWKLLEIADERGVTLDFLSVPDRDLDVVWTPSATSPRAG